MVNNRGHKTGALFFHTAFGFCFSVFFPFLHGRRKPSISQTNSKKHIETQTISQRLKGKRNDGSATPSMVYSTAWVAVVARTSADICQYAACNPERLSSDEALDAIFCLPMRFLSRFAVRVFSFFCFPLDLDPNPRRHFIQYSYSSSSSSFSDSSLDDGY